MIEKPSDATVKRIERVKLGSEARASKVVFSPYNGYAENHAVVFKRLNISYTQYYV